MSKIKIIILTILVWSIAAVFIFFKNDLSTLYYRLKNGTKIEVVGENYRLSDNSFLIGQLKSGSFAIGFDGENIVSIMVKAASVEELKRLNQTFPSVFKYHKSGNCIFLEKIKTDDNLPDLVWYNYLTGFYFTTSNKGVDKDSYSQLCNLLIHNSRKG